ncbi:MAG: Ig-like domain-containing protein [Candidatus Woesearchaeota archaeon]
MKTPTRILFLSVLFAIAVMALSGCVREEADEKQYTEVENLSELGISEEAEEGNGSPAGTGEETDEEEEQETDEEEEIPDEKDTSAESGEGSEDDEDGQDSGTRLEEGKRIVIREGQKVEVKPKAFDPDGDKITYSFSPPLDEEGEWQTEEGDEGTYKVQVTASSKDSKVTKEISLVVKEKNKAPELKPIDDVQVKAGEKVELSPEATDPNDDELTFRYSGWMDSAVKTTDEDDIGDHEVKVTASDGELSDSATVEVSVVPENNAPVMENIKDITIKEGETVLLEPNVVDPDGDEVTVDYSGWMDSAEKKTDYEDEGTYSVDITASDGELETTQTVTITVEDKPREIQDFTVDFEVS